MRSQCIWTNSWGNLKSCYHLRWLLPVFSFTNGSTNILNWYAPSPPQKAVLEHGSCIVFCWLSGVGSRSVVLHRVSLTLVWISLTLAQLLKPVFSTTEEFYFFTAAYLHALSQLSIPKLQSTAQGKGKRGCLQTDVASRQLKFKHLALLWAADFCSINWTPTLPPKGARSLK